MKIYKTILASSMLLSWTISAQEFDDAFIKSLPSDIQTDVLERTTTQGESLEDNYNAYQYSSKLELEEDLLELKNRLEIDLAELERRLRSDPQYTNEQDLKLFGSDFFDTFQTSFMPINEPNPDSSYTLDIGDVLKIQLIGQKEYIENFPVNGNGSINIPDIGEISVVGLPLLDASKLIKSKITQTYIGVEAFINIYKIRDVNILITGNAKNPGIYTLTGNSNILHALSAAGGIDELGSYRAINLIRNNQVIETLDLYSLIIDGNYYVQKRLRSGDVIFVEPIKNVVTIDGAVKRPAKYEVKNDEFLDKVIKYANGLKTTADISNISLERIIDGTQKTIPILNSVQFKKIVPVDGDLIYIREFNFRQAKIHGAVKKPGTYTMANGETLNDLIKKAGGLNENAYLYGAVYLNKEAETINQKAKDILYEEFLDNLIAASQKRVDGNFDLTPIINLTREIKNSEPNGRIVIDLVDDKLANLFPIADKDELYIPEMKNNIYLYGEISSEGSIMYEENKGVEYFINKSGGYKNFADVSSIYVLHPNGESERYIKRRSIFENSPASDINLYPGSIIFVPRKIDESTSNRLAAQAYVSILGSLGIALASLSSINNN